MRNIYIILITVLTSFTLTALASTTPNIIVILTDDMGYSDLGCYGSEIETPNLDKLAEQGLRFSSFYNTSRCSPTRSSLMTGLYSHQAGMGLLTRDQGSHNPGYRGRLMERCVTIAEVLSPQGYRNIITGKWHMGDKKKWWPLARGFDNFYGCPQGGGFYFRPSSWWQKRLIVRDYEVLYDAQKDPPEGWYTTDAYTDEGIQYIKDAVKEKSPFFWYLAYNTPHFPLQAKPEDIAKYRGRYTAGWDVMREQRYQNLIELGLIDEKWPLAPREKEIPAWDTLSEEDQDAQDLRMAIYAAMIDNLDQNIGKIISNLKELGVFDNTLILFLHDNGGQSEKNAPLGYSKGPGEPGTVESDTRYGSCWANVSGTPFRKYKNYVHEGGISTPLIAHWPRGISSPLNGSIIHEPAHLIDIMASIVDITGASYPESYKGHEIIPMEGCSLLPLMQGQPFKRSNPIFFEHEGNQAIRDGEWKLVRTRGKQWELYNMLKDRTETNNLAKNMPEKVKDLSILYQEWAERAFVLKRKKPKKEIK